MYSKGVKMGWLSLLIFMALLAAGFCLSERKVLWGDEIYTQRGIDGHSYVDFLTLHFLEGNRSPLFYIIQKTVSDMFSFRLTIQQTYEQWVIHDERSQVIMRISSNVSMSLALAVLFYFFSSRFSVGTGLYALGLALAMPMVWRFWVEARPYSLWFLLTTIQLCLAYIAITSKEKPRTQVPKALLLTHLLLSLTTIGAMAQIIIVSLMVWRFGSYKKQWALLVPAGIILFYFWAAPGYAAKVDALWSLLLEVVMPEHLIIYALYGFLLWRCFDQKKPAGNAFFLMIFLLFLASAVSMLFIFSLKKTAQFGFYSRYLIYMVPLDIMMMTLASRDLMQWAKKNTGMWINTGILLGGLLICRALMTYAYMLALGIYSHTPG